MTIVQKIVYLYKPKCTELSLGFSRGAGNKMSLGEAQGIFEGSTLKRRLKGRFRRSPGGGTSPTELSMKSLLNQVWYQIELLSCFWIIPTRLIFLLQMKITRRLALNTKTRTSNTCIAVHMGRLVSKSCCIPLHTNGRAVSQSTAKVSYNQANCWKHLNC